MHLGECTGESNSHVKLLGELACNSRTSKSNGSSWQKSTRLGSDSFVDSCGVVEEGMIVGKLHLWAGCVNFSAQDCALRTLRSAGSDFARRRAPGTGVGGTGAMWMKEFCTTQPDALIL
jgi:hypothetical protein